MRVILNNLISNAIKYRRHDIPLSLIQVNVEVQEDKVLLSVSDNGEGIPDEKLPHIFDMFYRASESSEGSGLGMYIVKNIINKIGGEISLRSKVGEGSTFSVVLPNVPIEEE